MSTQASHLARRLAEQAETVCRHYLSNGRRIGRYWAVGDVRNTPGRSMFVRLRGPSLGKGAAGKWTDAATAQGSKLIGTYDSQVSFGQDCVLLVWTRLIMPSGRSIVLERQPGADTQGFAGLEDEVDHHWARLVGAAALSTLLGVGAELGATNNDSAILTALRRGSSDSLNQTGQQVVRRNLNIQPTITIRPGFPVRVIVNRDLMLAPYRIAE
jgi:Bacterial conjugation TrbI-like protein